MNQSQQHYTNEQTGISYTLSADGYYLPDLTLPEEPEYDVGIYGLMRRNYLKRHRRGLFTSLLTSGKLNEHLYEIDRTAISRMEFLSAHFAEREGATEQLKSVNSKILCAKCALNRKVCKAPTKHQNPPTCMVRGFMLARRRRFELPTFWSVARRSIQLSYRRSSEWTPLSYISRLRI